MRRLFNTQLKASNVDIPLLLIRLAIGGFMLTHGIPKLLRLFSAEEVRFSDPFGIGPAGTLALAVFAEFFCSVCIILGMATRLATIPLLITMTTAAFYAHADDPFGTKEKPLLFILVYFTLLVFGSGRYSIDQLISKRSIQ